MSSDEELLLLSIDSTKRCHWLQHFGLMNIFEHVWKPAITACRNCSALHAINCKCNHGLRQPSAWGIQVRNYIGQLHSKWWSMFKSSCCILFYQQVSLTGDMRNRQKMVMFTDKIISKLQDQSHNKQQHLTNLLRKIQRITKHNVWDSLPKSYNYNPAYLLTFNYCR